ncbi:type III pantothenate kinase [Eubacteriales bacterium OttesenSCG-928-A19]|nr:type III pantothenate kinase [Eubacteriales bacterium OttesenSCG-928-A19]
MILTLDIGNTNIKTAVFDGEALAQYWRLKTDISATSDEVGITLVNLFRHNGLPLTAIDGIIMSSVVPSINFTIEHMCRTYFGMEPKLVVPGVRTGINIKYENPKELGSDRIANAVAAYTLYGGPCIFIDFGTATTFGVVLANAEFIGGAICPGLKLSTEALVMGAAKLPRVEILRPESPIGRNTVSNMQAGIFYGYVGQINHIVAKMKEELDMPETRVIATGGLSRLIASDTNAIDVIDGLLTLKGLRIIYERNREDERAAEQ